MEIIKRYEMNIMLLRKKKNRSDVESKNIIHK